MVDAALWLEERAPLKFTHDLVRGIAARVEPDLNKLDRYRVERVTIGGVIMLPAPEHVDRLMDTLLATDWNELLVPRYVADAFFKEFEEIHPFVDGNGRTGSIIWNYMLGYLVWPYDQLEDAPSFWDNTNKDAVLDWYGGQGRTPDKAGGPYS
jgi:hypothetical protein